MIERVTIDGREATVVHMDRKFVPKDKDVAELVKVQFDDGEVLYLVPKNIEKHT